MPRLFRFPWRSHRQIRDDLEIEMEFHIQMRAGELMSQGMNESDARDQSEREFGDRAFTRAYCERLDRAAERETRRVDWFRDLWQDLRTAARGVRVNSAYAGVVILTLALGVGANTAVFSVLDSVLLHRMPFPRADRLVTVDDVNLRTGFRRSDISVGEYMDWVQRQRSFEGIAMHAQRNLTYTGGDLPELLVGRQVSANFFDVFRVTAALGRTFRPGEDRGVNRIVVLTDGTWRRLFGADKGIINRSIVLGGDTYTVIGVLPPDFVFPGSTQKQFYVPINFTSVLADVNRSRKFHFMHGFARLKDGVTFEQAQADIDAIGRTVSRENPTASEGGSSVGILPLDRAVVGDARVTILALMGAAAFVLLIVVANLANLALSRALLRRQEFAVRSALGASRGRLVRLALTESVGLGLIGGAVGVAIAWWGTPALLRLYPGALPALFQVGVSPVVLVFALAVAAGTGVAFGLVPALSTSRGDVVASLRDGSRGASAGRVRTRGRNALAVAQMSLAMVLVVGAGLLIQTLVRLQSVELGYAPSGASATWISLAGPRYRQDTVVAAFWTSLLERLRQDPRVKSVGLGGSIPLAGGSGSGLAIEGLPNVEPLPSIRYSVFSPGMLKALGVPLKAGRDFSMTKGGGPEILVNEAAAKKYWPASNAVGARVRLGPDPSQPWATVVGVIGDYKQEQLDAPAPPEAITDFLHDGWNEMFVTIRSSETPEALRAIVAGAVHDLDPTIAVETPSPLSAMIDQELGPRRFAMSILSVFGIVALVLAIVGIYGVIAYGVNARRREFGVRTALGAAPRQLMRGVMSQGARLALSGLLIGTVGAALLTRFLSNLLFGVERLDIRTFVVGAVVMGGAALAASFIPAWRAAASDPVSALRDE